MKLPKRRKKDSVAETVLETSAAPPPTPKVEVRKKARPTDDVLPMTALHGDDEAMGMTTTISNGHNGHNGRNGHSRDYNGTSTSSTSKPVDDSERRRLIAEAAYFRAVRRNFANGTPEADWLEAEAEVGAWLSQQR